MTPFVTVTIDDTFTASTGYVPTVDPTTGCEWVLTNLEGWFGGVDVRGAPVDRPMVDGSFDGPAPMGSRTVTVEGTVTAPDRAALHGALDKAAAVLIGRARRTGLLVVAEDASVGGLGRQALVRLGGATMIKRTAPTTADFSFSLFAADPLRYDVNRSSVTLARFVAGGGRRYPFRPPRNYGAAGSSGTGWVNNAGTADTWPTVTFTGPTVNPSLTADDGRALAVNLALGAGEQLVLDAAARTVMQGGSSRRQYLRSSSRWFELPAGRSVAVRFNADAGTGSATVSYRSAWV